MRKRKQTFWLSAGVLFIILLSVGWGISKRGGLSTPNGPTHESPGAATEMGASTPPFLPDTPSPVPSQIPTFKPFPTPTSIPLSTQTPTLTPSNPNQNDNFPLGLYDVPLQDFLTVREAGFDFVHIYDSKQTLENAANYLRAAQAVGLQVMQNMPSAHLHDGDEFWIKWVSTLAAYNNLAWWYLPEEPRRADHKAMQRLYEIVHQYDPQGRPAAVYFGTTHLDQWCDVSDIMILPAYPEYHQFPRVVARAWPDIARDACQDKGVVSVQALFDANFNGTGERPTLADVRTDAYTAIIAGSQGLAWYSYGRGKDLPDLWSAVKTVAQEVKTLSPIIAAPPISPTFQVRVLSGPTQSPAFEGRSYDSVMTLQKIHAGAIYILAVNLAEAPVTLQFENLPEDIIEVEVLSESRTLSITNKAFRDEFSPTSSHIYKVGAQIGNDTVGER